MDDFISLKSFAVFGSAAAVVVVLVNTVRHVTGWGPRWFALIVAVLVAAVGSVAAGAFREGFSVAAAAAIPVNGAFLYATAFGLQNSVVHPAAASGSRELRGEGSPRFASPW
jgi:hypothetical protein